MNSGLVFSIILLNMKFSFEENIFKIYPDWNTEKTNLRERFLNRKRQNQEEETKIKLFDTINSNKTLFVAGILHLLDDDHLKNKMESSFRNVLRMNGSKYIFKRDFFWRTWREVRNESGYSSIICYKCQSIVNKTCAKCHTGGYWVIEEKPPNCPYEIFSKKSEQELCTINYTEYFEQFNSCPSVISVRDLKISCGNPIETKWRIATQYNVPERQRVYYNTERTATVICQGRENCEILTLYSILSDSILFSIINSTNHVFYSRAMKAGNKNYICSDNCGVYNPLTKEIIKQDSPLIVDLLNNKNKRENKQELLQNMSKNNFNMMQNKVNLLNGLHYKEQNAKKIKDKLKMNKGLLTMAQCKKLQKKYLEEQENESYYDYV